MPTKSTIKLIQQIQKKKYRKKFGLFTVEGKKSVIEFNQSTYKSAYLFVTEEYGDEFPDAEIITSKEMKEISNLHTPPNILGVYHIPTFDIPKQISQTCFALDNVQDPGNLGTIIRLADWFGMKHLFCNENTVDLYNPKVVQASMGSMTRVKIHYVNLTEFLSQFSFPVYGTFMGGENIYQTDLSPNGILVLGNEANGISKEIEALCHKKISIPQKGNNTESLNVAMASAIIAGEIFRRNQ